MRISSIFKRQQFLLFLLAWLTISSCSKVSIRPFANNKAKKERSSSNYASSRTYKSKKRETTKRPKAIASSSIRNQVVASALKHVGTKYVYGGKHPGGFDCSGFTSFVLKREGLPVSGSSRDQAKMGKRKSKNALAPGDLAFFGSKGKVTHVGIVKENTGSKLIVVHSTTSKGVRTDDINGSQYWRGRFLFGRDVID